VGQHHVERVTCTVQSCIEGDFVPNWHMITQRLRTDYMSKGIDPEAYPLFIWCRRDAFRHQTGSAKLLICKVLPLGRGLKLPQTLPRRLH